MLPSPVIVLGGKILQLFKALCGLQQGPLQWFQKLASILARLGFVSLHFDPCVFINHELKVIFVVYIVDITTVGKSEQIKTLVHHLKFHFTVTVKGVPKYILGIKVTLTDKGLHLCQC